MKLPSSWAAAYVTPLFVLLVTTAVLMTGVSDAWAYNTYSTDGETGNCANCHGDFRTSPYISLVDGVDWENSLHNVHRNGMLGGDCATCHAASGFSPVSLESSEGGNGLEAISCVGCHGRQADEDSPSAGWGAGLRQHHVGEANCSGCHDDQTGYTPVGENVLPNYYANPGSGHPDIPMDSCNPDGTESLDFSGTALGLDNDGDSLYDGNDPDCPVLCQSDAFCDNGQFCDGAETCDLGTGECVVGTPVDPDDGVGCTDDSCDEANDVVVNAPNDGLCDNGQFCDGSETCDAVNDCQAGTPVDVDDGVGCTDDSCDEANDVVVNAPNDGLCDNGQFCDGSETCDAVSDCQAGTPPVVDDGVGCTDDSCDEANDVVVNTPNDGLCDNGEFCDGSETCDATEDCQAGTAPCDPATETCDEVGDICEAIGCTSDAECDNGMFCDGSETCNTGTGECLPGTPVDVDDGVGCTDDSCDEANDVVVNAPNDGLCDNGQFCDGSETCDAVSDCQAGTPPVVDDGVGCTDDSCDEANDVVVNTPNDGLCDNGEFCDGSETCDATEDCQAGTAPCDPATETCDEVGDICEAIGCTSDAECDNGMFCDGSETCNTGTGECLPGTPVDVDDGVGCTDDSCDEANDVVVNAPNDGLCDNGEFCDGSETCDATEDCQAGTAPCDPATETCDEAVNMCEPIEMLDLDVASLKVTKRVSLQRVKPIGITLGVKNNGTVEGTAFATITGMQNGIEVYNETLTVTDAVGNGRTKYNDRSVPSIPTFEPRFEGDILWRVTIADTDPDNDAVTAVTTVVP